MSGPHLQSLTIEDIRLALAAPLPGVAAQKKMAPQPRPGSGDRWQPPSDCREASVLILLYPHNASGNTSELYLVLIRRPEYPGVHSGQISFPGGRQEDGESLQTTALRETMEEVGVPPEMVQVMGRLSTLYTPPSNFCIHPFVAFSAGRPNFRLDRYEVAELLEAPLNLLLDPTICKNEDWHFPKDGLRRVPFFDIFGHKVWGATAMILSEFLALLNKSATGQNDRFLDGSHRIASGT